MYDLVDLASDFKTNKNLNIFLGSFRDSKSRLENQASIDSCSQPIATPGSSQGAATTSQTAAARSSTPQQSIPFFRSSSEAKHPNFRQVCLGLLYS